MQTEKLQMLIFWLGYSSGGKPERCFTKHEPQRVKTGVLDRVILGKVINSAVMPSLESAMSASMFLERLKSPLSSPLPKDDGTYCALATVNGRNLLQSPHVHN